MNGRSSVDRVLATEARKWTGMSEEQSLVEALKNGEEWAFESAVATHSASLLAVAFRVLRDEDDAKELVQDSFVRAFRGIDRFRNGAKLGTWLYRITWNGALGKLRMRRCRIEGAVQVRSGDFASDFAPWDLQPDSGQGESAGPERALELSQTRDAIRACVDDLPAIYRETLLLRDIQELNTSEAATLLGVSPGCVRLRLHRARQAMRSLLAGRFDEANQVL